MNFQYDLKYFFLITNNIFNVYIFNIVVLIFI